MPNPFILPINSLLPEPHASLLLGILFGVRAQMPRDLYQSLITTGTLHIIALSGMNISILIVLTAKITGWMGRQVSSIFTICFIVLFVLFVGPTPSVVRAAIMGSLSLLAVYLGRKNWALLSLFLAGGVMLLWDSHLLGNISFQLSFLATLGLILANRKTERQTKNGLKEQLISTVKANFRLTLSAQLFTLPILLFTFHRISLISPIANVLIEWAIAPIMILGFITSLLGLIWQPLGLVPAWFTWIPLTYVLAIVDFLARIPLAAIQF